MTREHHPHLAESLPDGWVRVDCHVHTMWSGDATTTPHELRAAVAASGVEVVCITDHGTTNGAVAVADDLGCRVVVGQEVRTHVGELIGLFLTERVPDGLSAPEVARRIRGQGGLVYVPHPFDPMRRCLRADALEALAAADLIDIVEARNAKTSLEHLNAKAATFASDHGLAVAGGSDAHVPDALGAACTEMPDFVDADSFLSALRSGRVVGHHFDAPRPWSPRVVPSTVAR